MVWRPATGARLLQRAQFPMPEHVDRVMRMAMARHRRRGATPDGRLYEGHAFLYDLVKRLSSTTPAS